MIWGFIVAVPEEGKIGQSLHLIFKMLLRNRPHGHK